MMSTAFSETTLTLQHYILRQTCCMLRCIASASSITRSARQRARCGQVEPICGASRWQCNAVTCTA